MRANGAVTRIKMTACLGVLVAVAVVMGLGVDAAGAQPAADAAEVDAQVSGACFNPRGRVDVQLVNNSESRQQFDVRVGSQTRYVTVNGRSLARVPVTNLRDGSHTVSVTRMDVYQPNPLVQVDVPITCEEPTADSVSGPEVSVVAACGAGTVAELRMANATQAARSYRIEITMPDGETTTSTTTAAGFGVSFRRLTLPTRGAVALAVSSSASGAILQTTVDPECDRPLTATANNILDLDANSSGVRVARNSDGVPLMVFAGRNEDHGFSLSYGWPQPSDLRLLTCADAACHAAAGEPVSILTGTVEDPCCTQQSYFPFDLELGPEGYPVILYGYSRGEYLSDDPYTRREGLVLCNDPGCTGGDETITQSSRQDDGYQLESILSVSADGLPKMLGSVDDGAVIVTCLDRSCAEVDVTPAVVQGEHDGGPANPWWSNDGTRFVCNDADCTGGEISVLVDPLANAEDVRVLSSTRDRDGHPAYLFRITSGTVANRRLQLLRCTDALCAGDVSTVAIREADPTSDYQYRGRSLLFGPDGSPSVVGVRGSESGNPDEPDLWLTICQDVACSQQITRTLMSQAPRPRIQRQYGRFLASVSQDASGAPLIITSRTNTETYWTIDATKCLDAECSDGADQSEGGAELDLVASCFSGQGRADAYVHNVSPYRITVTMSSEGIDENGFDGRGAIEQSIDVDPGDVGRVALINLGQGSRSVSVWTSGSAFASVTETSAFDCEMPVDADQQDPSASEWAMMSGCRDGAGVIELYKVSAQGESFVLESDELGNRSTTATPKGLARLSLAGVPDGSYPLNIRGVGVVATPVIECAVTSVVSCLAGRGRVDIFVANATGATLQVEVVFGTLTPRTAAVQAGDLHRFAITGRRNGPHAVTVSAVTDGGQPKVLWSGEVTIECASGGVEDDRPGPVDEVHWRALGGCRDGAGVIELVGVSPGRNFFDASAVGLEDRRVMVRDAGLIRFMFDGVADGTYVLTRPALGREPAVELADVTINCTP